MMAKRSRDWNEQLARDLRSRRFAQQFILSALEEDIKIQAVLSKVIRAYGIKEFAAKAGLAPSNLSRALNPKYNPTQATLDRILRPFGLRLTVAPISQKLAA